MAWVIIGNPCNTVDILDIIMHIYTSGIYIYTVRGVFIWNLSWNSTYRTFIH